MATQHGTIRMHQDLRGVTVQVVGWGRMNQSLSVRRLGEACLAESTNPFRIDLRQCTYLDSTFLGTLLYLQRAARRLGKGQLLLVSPSSQCWQLFKQIGVDGCFSVQDADLPGGDWCELACPADDVEAFNANVVQAHEEFVHVGGTAAEQFQAVVRCLHGDRPRK